jgi:hypothetical protein
MGKSAGRDKVKVKIDISWQSDAVRYKDVGKYKNAVRYKDSGRYKDAARYKDAGRYCKRTRADTV